MCDGASHSRRPGTPHRSFTETMFLSPNPSLERNGGACFALIAGMGNCFGKKVWFTTGRNPPTRPIPTAPLHLPPTERSWSPPTDRQGSALTTSREKSFGDATSGRSRIPGAPPPPRCCHGDLVIHYHGPGKGAVLIALKKATGETVWQYNEPDWKPGERYRWIQGTGEWCHRSLCHPNHREVRGARGTDHEFPNGDESF